MARRSLRTGVGAGALALVLIAAGCGNSKSTNTSNSGGAGGSNVSQTLAKVDCGKLTYDPNAPTGGTFTDYNELSDNTSNTSFDPAVTQTLSEAQITTAVWDGLTDFDFTEKCNPKLKGLIAKEGWKVNANATKFTFTLKPGYVFSNGEPVLPHNFKQGWERAGSKTIASPYGYLIAYVKGGADLQKGTIQHLSSIVADDKAMTLDVTLEKPNADFPAIITHQFFSPISDADMKTKATSAGWGDKGATIGNGPFMIQSAPGPDKDVTLVPNPKWKGNVYGDTKVHLDKIVFKSTAAISGAYQAFDAGSGDNAPIPPGQYKQAYNKYTNNTVKDPNLGTYYFDIGAANPEVAGPKNLDLRIAINLAVNRVEINNKVYEGYRSISTGITPPGIPGFKTGLCKYCTFNLAAAKQHLAAWRAAGGKLTSPIKIEYNPGGGHDKVSQIIQADLKTVGIDSKLDPITQSYFKEVAKAGACNLCRSGWYADYPTYGNFMVDLFGAVSIDGNNFGRFNNPDFEKAIALAQGETDPTKRGLDYQKAEDILLNQQVVVLPLNWYTGSAVFRDRVVNNDQPPLGLFLWERMAVKG